MAAIAATMLCNVALADPVFPQKCDASRLSILLQVVDSRANVSFPDLLSSMGQPIPAGPPPFHQKIKDEIRTSYLAKIQKGELSAYMKVTDIVLFHNVKREIRLFSFKGEQCLTATAIERLLSPAEKQSRPAPRRFGDYFEDAKHSGITFQYAANNLQRYNTVVHVYVQKNSGRVDEILIQKN
jgi:hypothetical protein